MKLRTKAKLFVIFLPPVLLGLTVPLFVTENPLLMMLGGFIAAAGMASSGFFGCPVCNARLFTRGSSLIVVSWPFKKCWKCGHVLD